jgi:Protein of unknown function (DUF1223)
VAVDIRRLCACAVFLATNAFGDSAPLGAAPGSVPRCTHDRSLDVSVHVDVPPTLTLRESADVFAAITEDNLVTEVRRGGNGGRTLRHSAVVRTMTSVGTLAPTSAPGRRVPPWPSLQDGNRRTSAWLVSLRNAKAAASSAPAPGAVPLSRRRNNGDPRRRHHETAVPQSSGRRCAVNAHQLGGRG